ncbi:hypothetical protein OUZ56_017045 [Daphnia magna]|uniref:Uncharacterized protein n=1 Tax=Daphnia magna TaxID=35525 RepID=A0ABR0AS29_9CRUS|nr:hypothetical protein OUZ56_017045 [Daphnia magna]
MDSTDSDKRIRPYSSRHSRRLLSQHVRSLDNHFGENSSNEYDVNQIDPIPTVTEPMEDDFQSCYSDFDADEDYDSDCSPIATGSEFESSSEESIILERLAEFDEDSNSDIEENDSFSFREVFALWAVTRNICQNAIDELLSIFRKFPWEQMLSVIDDNSIPVEILIKISVDGVPMSKSSKSQLWPLTDLFLSVLSLIPDILDVLTAFKKVNTMDGLFS